MLTFSELIDELISNINYNRGVLYGFSNKNPNLLFKKLTELASFTGSRHHVALQLHFPDPKKIKDTLFLPETNFPLKNTNHSEKEKKIRES